MEELTMTKETLDFVTAKTKELMAAPSCSKEAKDAAQAWLNAVGTAGEAIPTEIELKGSDLVKAAKQQKRRNTLLN